MKVKYIIGLFCLMASISSCEKEKIGGVEDKTISFKNDINPLIQGTCSACHDMDNSYVLLTESSYATITENAWVDTVNPEASIIYNAHNTNDKFKEYVLLWIQQGAKNN